MIGSGWIGVVLLTACATDDAPSASSSTSATSPYISTPASAGNPPVTMDGYVETSATTQVR